MISKKSFLKFSLLLSMLIIVFFAINGFSQIDSKMKKLPENKLFRSPIQKIPGLPKITSVTPVVFYPGDSVTITGENLQDLRPVTVDWLGWNEFIKISYSAHLYGKVFVHINTWRNSDDGKTITFDVGQFTLNHYSNTPWQNEGAETVTGQIRLAKPPQPGTSVPYESYFSVASPQVVTWNRDR